MDKTIPLLKMNNLYQNPAFRPATKVKMFGHLIHLISMENMLWIVPEWN